MFSPPGNEVICFAGLGEGDSCAGCLGAKGFVVSPCLACLHVRRKFWERRAYSNRTLPLCGTMLPLAQQSTSSEPLPQLPMENSRQPSGVGKLFHFPQEKRGSAWYVPACERSSTPEAATHAFHRWDKHSHYPALPLPLPRKFCGLPHSLNSSWKGVKVMAKGAQACWS